MTLNDLKAKFPHQFAGPHINFTMHRGWLHLFAQLCADIDELLGKRRSEFHWVQLKEKFGSASWYWKMSDGAPVHLDIIAPGEVQRLTIKPKADMPAQVHALVAAATAKTKTMCIYCSRAGEAHERSGWLLVVCTEHRALRAAGAKLRAYLQDDEDAPEVST